MLIASKEAPVYTAQKVKVGSSEVERSSIKQYSSTFLVNLPQTSTIRTSLALVKQISVQIDIAKLQHPILVYYKFLIHYVLYIVYTLLINVYKQQHYRFTVVKLHKKHERRKDFYQMLSNNLSFSLSKPLNLLIRIHWPTNTLSIANEYVIIGLQIRIHFFTVASQLLVYEKWSKYTKTTC